MKLDDRIIRGKKPLDCFDAENEELIKLFLNKEGYVSNNLENFCLLDGCFKRLLSNVFKKVKDCFKTSINGGDGGDWKYFLPAEWVKESKKKWRAYTIAEFQETFTVGRAVRFRRKDAPTKEHLLAFGGYYTLHDGRVSILFGIHLYTLEELFEQYEWQEFYTDEYRPFGIEE